MISHFIIHCSDSPFGDRELIRHWHVDQNGWDDIGYHYVICNGRPWSQGDFLEIFDGMIQAGRPHGGSEVLSHGGAHVKGMNSVALGVCLIGDRDFTGRQIQSAVRLVREFQRRWGIPTTNVLGHYETPSGAEQGKTCPNLDMDWFRGLVDEFKPL